MEKLVLAADLGGTNLRMAAIDGSGEILHRVKTKTPRSDDGSSVMMAFVDAAKDCISNLSEFEFGAVGIAVPATVNVEDGVIIKAPNLPELNGYKLVRKLSERLDSKVVLENDANAAAIGEHWLGASKGFSNSIMITLGTGVGGGLIVNDKIIRGIDGTAGEIGHICVEPHGMNCGCSSHGCLEQYSSATAVVRIAKELSSESGAEEFGKEKNFTSKDLYESGITGNEVALEAFRRQGFYLGIVLGGLINTLNPEVIVIGGGAAAGWDLFIGQVQEQIGIRAYRKPAERAKLVRANLGDDAGILGVAFLALENSRH